MANIRYNFSSGSNGTINYNSDIVTNIVEIAVKEVEGVYGLAPKNGIRLDFQKDGVYVAVSVILKVVTDTVPEIAFRIQNSIRQSVESMTRYKIANVDVHVQEVVFSEEIKTEKRTEESGEESAEKQ